MRISSWRSWYPVLLLSIPNVRHLRCSAVDSKAHLVVSARVPEVLSAVPYADSQTKDRQEQEQQQQQQQQQGRRRQLREEEKEVKEEKEGVDLNLSCVSVGMDEAAVGTISTRKENGGSAAAGAAAPAGGAENPEVGSSTSTSGGSISSGSTSGGKSEEDYIPERYIVGCSGDRVEAARRWEETLAWRQENKVDEILERPQPRFEDCRQIFPVYLHGRSRRGLPVLWERIGKVNVAKSDELKLPLSALTMNYVFFNECIWRVVLDKGEDDNDDAQFITVEDVSGVRPWHVTPKVLSVIRALTGTMKAHYVERCHKSYIINAPRAFTALWRIVSPMLDSRTRGKISILGTDFLTAMEEEIDISQIPPEYGGSSGRDIDDSDDERKIKALLARLDSEAEVAAGTVPNES